MEPQLISRSMLDSAANLLSGVATRTPLLPIDIEDTGGISDVWVKAECLQRAGAFKVRGAFNFVSALSAEQRSKGLIAPSSGNHAQAVAWAARSYGVPCTVVMPTTAPLAKRSGAERLGANVVLHGSTSQHRIEYAADLAKNTGAVLVPPFDHELIIAGQGTVGLEIISDMPNLGTVIVPVGGGGLASGVASAVKLANKNTKVICVEPSGAPKLSRAIASASPVTLDSINSIADGLLGVRLGDLPWEHLSRLVDQVVQVDDDSIRKAMGILLNRYKLVVEPSGAAAFAALFSPEIKTRGTVAVVLSGGNVELEGLMAHIAQSDMKGQGGEES